MLNMKNHGIELIGLRFSSVADGRSKPQKQLTKIPPQNTLGFEDRCSGDRITGKQGTFECRKTRESSSESS